MQTAEKMGVSMLVREGWSSKFKKKFCKERKYIDNTNG